ncbi:translation initiation factor IF-2-like [Panthera leo]|uniref:translation initiation factor IF-2-like n=1 Tax=Panthera leo TaxID=9689 RepID=UPI001C6A6605|nr:translation initiation factor IF-2-like [Panthera leo]
MVEGPGARRPGRGGGGVGAWRPRDAALPARGAAGDPPRAAGGGGSGPRLGAPDASRRGAGRGRGGARGQVEASQETGRPSSPHSEPARFAKCPRGAPEGPRERESSQWLRPRRDLGARRRPLAPLLWATFMCSKSSECRTGYGGSDLCGEVTACPHWENHVVGLIALVSSSSGQSGRVADDQATGFQQCSEQKPELLFSTLILKS